MRTDHVTGKDQCDKRRLRFSRLLDTMQQQSFSRITPIILLIAASVMGGCVREKVNGSAEPPLSFGKVARNVLGCADVSGLYAWPPAQATRARTLSRTKN